MAFISKVSVLLALGTSGVFATPTATAARLGDLLDIVSLDLAPLVTQVVTTTYYATAPTSYASSTYDTGCQCYYSTVYWWTPEYPYPTPSTTPSSTVTVTVTSTVPTTTTVTSTATVTPTCAPAPPTLSCDKYGYLVQNVTLFKVDLATGDISTVADHLGDDTPINAMAYNTLDDFLYARQSGKNRLIRIGSDGKTEVVGTFKDTGGADVGDIDTDGYYWYGAKGTSWYQLDLRPGSATYGTTLANGTADVLGLGILDWAYIPDGGPYLYTAGSNPPSAGGTSLARFSLETKKWEVVRNYPRVPRGTWGAVYGINNGTLYASDNGNGEIWAFPIDGGAAYKASQGPVSPGLNDGARCALNVDLS